jgi:hypothetical protein
MQIKTCHIVIVKQLKSCIIVIIALMKYGLHDVVTCFLFIIGQEVYGRIYSTLKIIKWAFKQRKKSNRSLLTPPPPPPLFLNKKYLIAV